MTTPTCKQPSKEALELADTYLAGPNRGCNCEDCVNDLARLLDSERAKARLPILDLQLFYDQLVDGQIIKESDGEPWPLTKSEAEQICKALQQRISIVWPRRALEQAADRKEQP